MDWRDEGTVIAVRRHGETAAIVEVFTAQHGRHAGVVRGGISRKIAPILQPGSQLSVQWRARLDEHLGTFVVEPLRSRAEVLADQGGHGRKLRRQAGRGCLTCAGSIAPCQGRRRPTSGQGQEGDRVYQ